MNKWILALGGAVALVFAISKRKPTDNTNDGGNQTDNPQTIDSVLLVLKDWHPKVLINGQPARTGFLGKISETDWGGTAISYKFFEYELLIIFDNNKNPFPYASIYAYKSDTILKKIDRLKLGSDVMYIVTDLFKSK